MKFLQTISILFVISINFISCTEDPIEKEEVIFELQLTGLEAIREGDNIKLTFDIPDNEHLKGYKIVDETSSFELISYDKAVNEYYIPTYPGEHNIQVYAIDMEDHLSKAEITSIHITDVYILGEHDETNIKYWKNGVGVEMEGAMRGIFVDGNDVYIVGNIKNLNTGNYIATYWKNGVPVTLSDGSRSERVFSIKVENNIVYVLGHVKDPVTLNWAIKCWANGVGTKLTDWSSDASAYINALDVEDGIIYATGIEKDPATGNGILKYWVNGEEVVLTGTHEDFDGGFIAVEGGNIYVAGNYHTEDANSSRNILGIKYWINGKEHMIPKEPQDDESTCGISVKGGKLCVPVYNSVWSGNDTYSYYLNGIEEEALIEGQLGWKITSYTSNAGDVYICGEERNLSTNLDMVTYWKNGEKVQLTDGIVSGVTNNIFVAD